MIEHTNSITTGKSLYHLLSVANIFEYYFRIKAGIQTYSTEYVDLNKYFIKKII